MRDVEITDEMVPRNATKLAQLAIKNGWILRCTHVVQPDGKDSIAVRLQRTDPPRMILTCLPDGRFAGRIYPQRLWGVWVDGLFDGGAQHMPRRSLNVTQLQEQVAS